MMRRWAVLISGVCILGISGCADLTRTVARLHGFEIDESPRPCLEARLRGGEARCITQGGK